MSQEKSTLTRPRQQVYRRSLSTIIALSTSAALSAIVVAQCGGGGPGVPMVSIALDRPVNTFTPDRALGAGVDGLEHGAIQRTWTRANLRAMRSAGFGALA